MDKTPNLQLNKPLESEYYDVKLFNENADKLDEYLSKVPQAGEDGKIPVEKIPELPYAPELTVSTVDLQDGSSPLETGKLYLVYKE